MTPRITVVMAVRDGDRSLAAAVDSILSQSFSNFELVVVDDGSRDTTPQLLAEYAKRDPRVRVLSQGPQGIAAALNRGLSASRSAIIARLDADDVALPDRLRRQLSFLESHPEILLLGSWAIRIDAVGRRTGVLKPPTQHSALLRALGRDNSFVHSSVMYRKSDVVGLGGYRAAFEAAEDYDLWLRLSERGQIANLAEPLVCYRTHEESITWRSQVWQAFSVRIAKRSARFRLERTHDPFSGACGPPDWSARGSFFAEEASIFRFLELSDAAGFEGIDPSGVDVGAFTDKVPLLTHRERKLGQQAALNILKHRRPLSSLTVLRLISLFVRLHPLRALKLGASLFASKARYGAHP
jgi:cellulose synthase/poly-beta-1,6-N-acetylglucosamine synthase-like glycosyltransferase